MNLASLPRHPRLPRFVVATVLGFLFPVTASRLSGAESVSFNEQIRPILSSRCFACHGPDEHSRAAGLRLDQPDGDEGAIGYAIEPGSVEDSELWSRITSQDPDSVMPPPDSHLKPLNEAERSLIRAWIEAGAAYENFWAYEPPTAPTVPQVADDSQSPLAPIDAFVLRRLEKAGLEPAPITDPRTLIRRLSFDLTGLPPTIDEVRQFVDSYREDADRAVEQAADRLIASPHFGEHFARYWLDLVRFADTNGMHKDFYRHQSPYRDWVIRAFNENDPYDEFVRDQVAGDLVNQPTRDQLIASGFNRLHLIIDRGTALPEESRFKNVLDRVSAVGTAFMGLTVQCAQCHDHKFDPITQKDFFSLYAFFDNIDAEPETVRAPRGGIQAPFIYLAEEDKVEKLAEFDRQIAEMLKTHQRNAERRKAEAESRAKVAAEAELRAKAEAEAAAKAQAEAKALSLLRQRRQQFDDSLPKAMVMRERAERSPTHIRVRGLYDELGEVVTPDTPGFLPPLSKRGEVADRLDLADWLVDRSNPLTARIAVNRFWQQFFGTGLVKTSEDFGSQGDVPSHPDLLDYLAVTFVDSGWDVKSIVRQIAVSKTYRRASQSEPAAYNADPDNRLLARGPRFRLDAEMIRDMILRTSGLLNDELFGDSVKPPQPEGLWAAVTMTGERFRPDKGDAIFRRSVYTFWKRGMPPPQMTILNAPIRDACTARRERTNTPLQALLLLNEREYLRAARRLALGVLNHPVGPVLHAAESTQAENTQANNAQANNAQANNAQANNAQAGDGAGSAGDAERIRRMWEIVTALLPDSTELHTLQNLLTDLRSHYSGNPELAAAMCADLPSEASERYATPESQAELAAWTMIGNTLYNLDLTKNKN